VEAEAEEAPRTTMVKMAEEQVMLEGAAQPEGEALSAQISSVIGAKRPHAVLKKMAIRRRRRRHTGLTR
jgi:hypothetical protein